MTKREEIREEIEKIIYITRRGPDTPSDIAGGIMSYLHSQGVVLKVDRELPNFTSSEYREFQDGINLLIDEGYVAVGSLIEEGR